MKITPNVFLALVAGVALLVPASSFAGLQTLTNKDGKSIQVELMALDGEIIKAKRNGKIIRFPINVLDAEDQGLVREWAKNNVKYSLRIEAKGKMKDSESSKLGNTSSLERVYIYDISVNNWANEPLSDIDVQYRIFTDEGVKKGSHSVSYMDAKATEEIETGTISFLRKKTVTRTGSS